MALEVCNAQPNNIEASENTLLLGCTDGVAGLHPMSDILTYVGDNITITNIDITNVDWSTTSWNDFITSISQDWTTQNWLDFFTSFDWDQFITVIGDQWTSQQWNDFFTSFDWGQFITVIGDDWTTQQWLDFFNTFDWDQFINSIINNWTAANWQAFIDQFISSMEDTQVIDLLNQCSGTQDGEIFQWDAINSTWEKTLPTFSYATNASTVTFFDEFLGGMKAGSGDDNYLANESNFGELNWTISSWSTGNNDPGFATRINGEINHPGIVRISGDDGGSLSLGGKNIPFDTTSFFMDTVNSFHITFIARINNATSGGSAKWSLGMSNVGGSIGIQFYNLAGSPTNLVVGSGASPGIPNNVGTTPAITDGQFHRFEIVKDGTAVTFLIDGAVVGSGTYTPSGNTFTDQMRPHIGVFAGNSNPEQTIDVDYFGMDYTVTR